ncbi:MAG: hypothetical protein K2J88_07235, partial [Oscillospiraceae bacterium]|nr:hypothetical protein [Oscillospiraceae bacterium]
MRRIFCILMILLCLTGCSSKEKNALPVSEQIALELPEEIQEETQEEIQEEIQETQMLITSIVERVELLCSENNYIHDENAVLSETEFEFYNNYLI